MVQTNRPYIFFCIFCIFETVTCWRALYKKSRNALCETVSMIEHILHIWHMSDSLHCCEQCRVSDQSTAAKISDRWEGISSLCFNNEEGVQGLCPCWSYACCWISLGIMHIGNMESRRIWKQWIDYLRLKTQAWESPQFFLMSTTFPLFSISE